MSRLNSFRKKGRNGSFGASASFRKQVLANHADEDIKILSGSELAGTEKMSEVVLEFIEPYEEFATSDDARKKLIVLAILAWNAANAPEAMRKEMVDEVSSQIPESERPGFRALIEGMIERKLMLFDTNKRLIIDYKLTGSGDSTHLSIASTLPEPK